MRATLAGENMRKSPTLVGRIVKMESAMAQKGLIPFVHAMPASVRVAFAFYRTVQQNGSFQQLRSPFDVTLGSRDEMWKQVPKEEERSQKPNLLSASYALTCNTTPLESAASWGFQNHFGSEQFFSMMAILNSFFETAEKEWGRPVPLSFRERSRRLVMEYNRLKTGCFFVLGVPKHQLSKWVYDSKPYNVPTGRSIEAVVENPELAVDGNIATLVVSKETQNPASGLAMVEANDGSAVAKFSEGLSFRDPNGFAEYRGLFGPPSPFETEEEVARETVDAKLRTLMADVQSWRKTRKEPVFEDDFQSAPWDFPPLLP